MEKVVRDDILEILKRVVEILKTKEVQDIIELKELSDHTIHDASIYQDIDSISMAILVYAVSKLLERGIEDNLYNQIANQFLQTRNNLQKNDLKSYNKNIRNLFSLLHRADKKVKLYIQEIMDKARIKKGSNLFSHGLSSRRVAEMMGVMQWELLGYIGHTQIVENYPVEGWPVSKRWNLTKEIFNL